jgi:hypothetical protein
MIIETTHGIMKKKLEHLLLEFDTLYTPNGEKKMKMM